MARLTTFLTALLVSLSVTALMPGAIWAQEGMFFARQSNWVDISHDTCITRATRSINSVNSSMGLGIPLDVVDGWLVGGNAIEVNVTIGCASDNDSLQLNSPYAARVLLLITVGSLDEILGMRVRDQIRDCIFSGECSVSESGATPVFQPEVNDVQQARDPRSFGRRRVRATVTQINWRSNAVDYREQIGTEFRFGCPELGLGSFTRVWGTDVYTTDSSICSAAVHAGMITDAGGAVAIQIVDGRSVYDASERHGVSSLNYGPWNTSFIFIEADVQPETDPVPTAAAPDETDVDPEPTSTESLDLGLDPEPLLELDD